MKNMTKVELTQELNRLEDTRNRAVEFGDLVLSHSVSYQIRQVIVELDSRG